MAAVAAATPEEAEPVAADSPVVVVVASAVVSVGAAAAVSVAVAAAVSGVVAAAVSGVVTVAVFAVVTVAVFAVGTAAASVAGTTEAIEATGGQGFTWDSAAIRTMDIMATRLTGTCMILTPTATILMLTTAATPMRRPRNRITVISRTIHLSPKVKDRLHLLNNNNPSTSRHRRLSRSPLIKTTRLSFI